MAAKAMLIVRAEILDPDDRPNFEHWYDEEHLQEAMTVFRADRAWRSWSRINPSSHYAFYEFAEVTGAHAALQSDATKLLVAKFDQVWGQRVTRTRDIVEIAQRLSNST